jgi:hypothetical protein
VKKVIVAIDLKIQRLQTKTVWLQNAQKVVENTMSKLKLDEITDWVQKQKDLYQLALVIQSFTTQMSDGGRLALINRAADAMQTTYKDLNAFTRQNIQLSLARSREEADIAVVKELYGIH